MKEQSVFQSTGLPQLREETRGTKDMRYFALGKIVLKGNSDTACL